MALTNIKDLKIGFNDQFFFDTNIWILLFATVADYQINDQKAYSKLLENLITNDKPIYITSMVVSEFSNVLLRRDYNHWLKTNKVLENDFKKNYVGTRFYKDSALKIANTISKILSLKIVTKTPDNFNSVNIDNILKNFQSIDFNDAFINEFVIEKKLKLVTNNKDFQKINSDIDIITTKI